MQQLKLEIDPNLDTVDKRVNNAMLGMPFWQRLLIQYELATVQEYLGKPVAVESNLQAHVGKRYRDIDMTGIHLFAPTDGVQLSSSTQRLYALVTTPPSACLTLRITLFRACFDSVRLLSPRFAV